MNPQKQIDWEGFEHFHDHQETDLITPSDIPIQSVTLHKSTHSPNKHRTHTHKNRQPSLLDPHKLANLLPSRQPSTPDQLTTQQPKPVAEQQDGKFRAVRKNSEKKYEGRRYERIPIIRFEEDCRYAGRIVYKGFVPRTSDNYMRLLREVDWEQHSEKKRDIRNLHGIEFNSQFESGNLNLAIEGRRTLV